MVGRLMWITLFTYALFLVYHVNAYMNAVTGCSATCAGTCNNSTGKCDWRGCDEKHWGPYCNKECHYCANEECRNTQDGQCVSCKGKKWGPFCNLPCGHCYGNDGWCNQTNAACFNCKDGYWGLGCNRECAENCKRCDKNSGHCIACLSYDFWGEACTKKCEAPCRSCEVNGSCMGGCPEGCTGDKCTEHTNPGCAGACDYCPTCKNGFWGSDCERSCSECHHGCDSKGKCLVHHLDSTTASQSTKSPKAQSNVKTSETYIWVVLIVGIIIVLSVMGLAFYAHRNRRKAIMRRQQLIQSQRKK